MERPAAGAAMLTGGSIKQRDSHSRIRPRFDAGASAIHAHQVVIRNDTQTIANQD
jgi:hypothetical protein